MKSEVRSTQILDRRLHICSLTRRISMHRISSSNNSIHDSTVFVTDLAGSFCERLMPGQHNFIL